MVEREMICQVGFVLTYKYEGSYYLRFVLPTLQNVLYF